MNMSRLSWSWRGGLTATLAGLWITAYAAIPSPGSINFGGQSMATTSAARNVTFTNDALSPITVSAVSLSNPQFAQTNNCLLLAAGASCTISITFKPNVLAGALNSTTPVAGTLTVTSSAASSPNTVALAGTAEKSLVTHYYRSILRRAPDAGGLPFWQGEAARVVGLGANVNETWFAMALGFFTSPEYLAFNRDNLGFVSDLYATFFNRTPDAGGLSFWTGLLSQGMPRDVALVSFMFSPEFANFTQAIFGNTAARAEVDTVVDFYRGLLSRLPDSGGYNFWLGQFRTAQCQGGPAVYTQVENISNSYVNSAEYSNRGRTNAQFVGDMYNAFLRRGGDLPGVQYWIGQLDSGARTRENVRQAFISTPEFNQRVVAVINQGCLGKEHYISPTGNNANTGTSAGSPWKTFAKAFGTMAPGDTLILLDGTYGTAAGTGYISYLGTNSAQPKSGLNLQGMTVVRAQNPGQVRIIGGLFIGRSTRKDSFIKIQGITFVGTSDLYNAHHVTLKDSGINGAFSVGTNDHDMYSDNNLIEDVWIWASGERIVAINYRSHSNVWRRVLVRGDGCGTAACQGSGNPNVGITVYDSSDISMQNVIVLDRILLAGDEPYGDFASAQHTADPQYYFGRNEWLGTMSIKAPDAGYYIEPDLGQIVSPTVRMQNVVAWDAASDGFNLARDGIGNVLEYVTANTNATADTTASALRIAPDMPVGGVLRSVLATGTGRFGINSKHAPTFANVFGTWSQSAYNQTTCSGTCFTTNPRADTPGPSLRYITRIEAASKLKGSGFNGGDIGANVVSRYGSDGSRFGDAGYNTLTSTPLWPWPNEARIKAELCATTTRGFCSTGKRLDGVNNVTLTSYVWEYLGNALPAGIYP